jgi:hypothetical protein
LAEKERQYRDPRRLTEWLRWLLIACILIFFLSGLNALAQAFVIGAISDGNLPSGPVMSIVTEANALRRGVFDDVAALVLFVPIANFGSPTKP